MRIGSLFSGVGGLELGLEWSGLGHTVWQVEQDEYCKRVLAHHWPDATRYDDVRSVGAATLAPVDLICGGFPCQDVSSAGKGAGLAGERSGLWSEFSRIVGELQPEWVVVENVLSGASRWLDTVVRELEEQGYECLPIPLSAEDVGAPHRRKRIFIVAHANRDQLREQQGWSGGAQRQDQAVAQLNGDNGGISDAKRLGCEAVCAPVGNANSVREPQPQRRELNVRRRPSDPGWWSTEPDVGRVAHGIPNRAHRLRALGNAVVPQCAEVIGYMIREMSKCPS